MKRYMVPNRLSVLVMRDGGLWRAEAIAAAERNVESIRERSLAALDGLVEEICAAAAPELALDPYCDRLERIANQIITLSGTYGLFHLCDAAKRLCDLLTIVRDRRELLRPPLEVHLSAIRLFAPHNPPPADESARSILRQLEKVLRFLDFVPAAEPALD